MDKICIWCSRSEPYVEFKHKAHTFPKSLGGTSICENVCDHCNHYFGSPQSQSPAIEVVLKEVLNISKHILLLYAKETLPKGKRYTSSYFDVNWEKRSIKLKMKYSLKKGFQEQLGRYFRRGLYKVFLEERDIQKKDALETRFDFIREFARFNLGDYPIYYMQPKFQAIFFSKIDTLVPSIRFTDHSDELENQFKIFDYPIMSHNFCIPTSKLFVELYLDSYKKYLLKTDNPFGVEITPIKYLEDIDFTFRSL